MIRRNSSKNAFPRRQLAIKSLTKPRCYRTTISIAKTHTTKDMSGAVHVVFTLLVTTLLCTRRASGTIVKRSHDDTQLCSYSFSVDASDTTTCPSLSSTASLTELPASLTELRSSIYAQHANIEHKLNTLLARQTNNCSGGSDNSGGGGDSGPGVTLTYKRWGRTTCPDNATLIYAGRTA